MEDHSANTSTDKNAIREHKIEITQHELPHQYFDGRRIHRVPQHLRSKEEDYYTPKFFSLGPYHHGSPQLSMTEKFKPQALQKLLSSTKIRKITKEILHSEVSKVIDQVSECYVGISEGIDDEKMTEIMVLDSCFFTYLMKVIVGHVVRGHFEEHFGKSAVSYVFQDICLLENQIPLWLIKHLLSLLYKKEEDGSKLLCNFLSKATFGDRMLKTMLDKPLHFLDACRILALSTNEDDKPEGGLTKCLKLLCGRKNGPTEEKRPRGKKKGPTKTSAVECLTKCLKQLRGKKKLRHKFILFNRQFRSVTDLKAKGIFFRPSSYCLKDIEFQSYWVCAVLRLPRFLFTSNSKRDFLNMVAYELSPDTVVGVDIICYLNFIKSLVLKPQDVRELREKEIFFSSLDSDEQVLQVIKEVDTFGVDFTLGFNKLKDRIEDHCNSKARTWIAEFFNTYVRIPWKFIALVAITLQLCLTIVQTYYAIHPAS